MESESNAHSGLLAAIVCFVIVVVGAVAAVMWRLSEVDSGGAIICGVLGLIMATMAVASIVHSARAVRWEQRHRGR